MSKRDESEKEPKHGISVRDGSLKATAGTLGFITEDGRMVTTLSSVLGGVKEVKKGNER